VRRVDPEAHDLCIQGMSHLTRLTSSELDTAMHYFELARGTEPALGWAGISAVWSARLSFGLLPAEQAGSPQKAAALEALKRDDSLPQAHLVLALVRMRVDWDWDGARSEFERALALSPNDAETIVQYARFEAITGNAGRAGELGGKAVELDPLRPVFQGMQGFNLVNTGRHDERATLLRRVQAQQTVPGVENVLGMAVFGMRQYDEVYRQLRTLFETCEDREMVGALDRGYAAAGYRGALHAGADLLAARTPQRPGDSSLILQMYAGAGDATRRWIDWNRCWLSTRPTCPA
jgi:tetratricopeptide (TPR) repeat protein